jgi:dTDP-4-dehydrorhamnose 3,5-epimerase-like enzyme
MPWLKQGGPLSLKGKWELSTPAEESDSERAKGALMRHKLIDLPLRSDKRGNLVFAQESDQIPFAVKRIFYIYDIPRGGSRAGHAHRQQHQYLIVLSGSCRVRIDDGRDRTEVRLDSPQVALYAPPLLWLDIDDFSAGSVCLVLTSDIYDEGDYVRDYAEFTHLTGAGGLSSVD